MASLRRRATRTAAIIATLVALMVSLVPAAAQAEEGEGRVRLEVGDLLGPLRSSLAGTSWLRTQGLEPRVSPRLSREQVRGLLSASGAPQAQGGGVLVPFRDPAPAFSRNILLTRDFSRTPIQTEPTVAINPKDPNHVIMSTIDYNFPSVSTYTTFDGGDTWEGPVQTPFLREDLTAGGDPVLAFDRNGNPFLAYISIGEDEFNIGTFVLTTDISSIAIARSRDGGVSWQEPVSTARSGVRTELTVERQQGGATGATPRVRGNVFLAFLDKPWLAIGPSATDPAKDNFYVTFVEFNIVGRVVYIDELPNVAVAEVQSTIKLVRSEDGGQTWSKPIDISPTVRRVSGGTPSPGPTGSVVGLKRVVQGAEPAVAPDGTVYVTWMDSTDDESQKGLAELYIARSEDGGTTFSEPKRMHVVKELEFRPRATFFRYWAGAFPKKAIGPGGELYVVYSALNPDKPADDGDIYFTRSFDRGDTWSRPMVLGGDKSNSLQFFPAVTTDPRGRIHVMWGDMRDDRVQTKYHIYYTTSENKGETWGFESRELNIRSEDARVTDFPSNPNHGFPQGQFLGDYFGIAASERDVYLVWADTRLGEFGGINQKIGFARRKAIASPDVFIQPPAGPGGQEVTIQGFNLQPDLNVFIQVGDVTIATERTNAEGRFTAQIFMPVSGQGAQSVRVLDESGNVATTSFFTEFGFGDLRTGQRDLSQRLDAIAAGKAVVPGGAVNGVTANGDDTEWWVIFVAALGAALISMGMALLLTSTGGRVLAIRLIPPTAPRFSSILETAAILTAILLSIAAAVIALVSAT